MDPLGTTANIIAIIHTAGRVIGRCQDFLEAVRDAPGDLRLILVEVSALHAVLENLKFLIKYDGGTPALEALSYKRGPIEGCRRVLVELETMLPEESVLRGHARTAQSKTKAIWTALAWTCMKEARAKMLLDELRDYKSTITLAITTESGLDVKELKTDTKKIKADTEDIKIGLTDVQQDHVYQWLSGTDPSHRHEDYGKNYESGTGEWLFRFPSWASWLEGDDRCLWVRGIPGAGKSTLAYRLIERVEEHCLYSGSGYAWAYYYCYFGHSRDESLPFLASILHQLCRRYGQVPAFLYEYYRQGRRPSKRVLLAALEKLSQAFDRVFIVIDAVDESFQREHLLGILHELASDSQRFKNVRLLATSREYIDIQEVMVEVSTPISMHNELWTRTSLFMSDRSWNSDPGSSAGRRNSEKKFLKFCPRRQTGCSGGWHVKSSHWNA
ncbi:hypothetical protein VTI74DRAFT_5006 [Chaetomium olivicolor]